MPFIGITYCLSTQQRNLQISTESNLAEISHETKSMVPSPILFLSSRNGTVFQFRFCHHSNINIHHSDIDIPFNHIAWLIKFFPGRINAEVCRNNFIQTVLAKGF